MIPTLRRKPAAGNLIATREALAVELSTTLDEMVRVLCCPARHYKLVRIPKLDGTFREIHPPDAALRTIQRALLKSLYCRLHIPKHLHGGVPKRSTVTHAEVHVGKSMVATLDVRSFFPSTTTEMIMPVLQAAGFRDAALIDAVSLVTLEDSLPQGAPTSTVLANLSAMVFDCDIIDLSRRFELDYTRYVDDLAISGDIDFRFLKGPITTAIEKAGYGIASEKVFFRDSSERQVVTGWVVNEKLRPTREYLQEVKDEIHWCLRDGPGPASLAAGLSVRELKDHLTGVVAHVRRGDAHLGRRLRGMLCGVAWGRRQTALQKV